jgi:hypothetical protein
MIYAVGDSYTYGDELDSQDQAWPAVLAQLLGTPVVNMGRSACGNTRIVKRAMDVILNGSATRLITGWTDPLRQETADQHGTWDLRPNGAVIPGPDHRLELFRYYTCNQVEQYYYAQWLRQVILLQSLCRLHRVDYTMFISCGAHISNQKFMSQHSDLVQHIDTQSFVGWPDSSMQSWTFHLPRGANAHPLQQGHQLTAEKIHAHIGH